MFSISATFPRTTDQVWFFCVNTTAQVSVKKPILEQFGLVGYHVPFLKKLLQSPWARGKILDQHAKLTRKKYQTCKVKEKGITNLKFFMSSQHIGGTVGQISQIEACPCWKTGPLWEIIYWSDWLLLPFTLPQNQIRNKTRLQWLQMRKYSQLIRIWGLVLDLNMVRFQNASGQPSTVIQWKLDHLSPSFHVVHQDLCGPICLAQSLQLHRKLVDFFFLSWNEQPWEMSRSICWLVLWIFVHIKMNGTQAKTCENKNQKRKDFNPLAFTKHHRSF